MLNVRRSDGRVLNWILDRQRAEGWQPEPGYCSDVQCEAWASGDVNEQAGIRWCDGFFEHAHVEAWDQIAGRPKVMS